MALLTSPQEHGGPGRRRDIAIPTGVFIDHHRKKLEALQTFHVPLTGHHNCIQAVTTVVYRCWHEERIFYRPDRRLA
jgi:hypothetical protein